VIAPSSPLIDKTIDEVWFNRTYDAAVLAFHRNGEDIDQKISQIPLKMGDTLILLAGKGFRRIWQNSKVFNFATPLREDLDKKPYFAFALICLVLMIIIPELDSMAFMKNIIPNFPKIPLVLSVIICGCLFILFKLVEKSGLMKLIEWNVLIVIAASFGISNALQNSGAAALVGNWILQISGDQSPWLALALIYIGANLLTELISNNAAAAIFFPLALTTATALHVNPIPFIMAVMIAASAGYSTPYGYQTHMMVYGPGNYKNLDFVKIGVPLNIMYFVISVLIIPFIWKF
jgi:di/tricarboxylate transporter